MGLFYGSERLRMENIVLSSLIKSGLDPSRFAVTLESSADNEVCPKLLKYVQTPLSSFGRDGWPKNKKKIHKLGLVQVQKKKHIMLNESKVDTHN